MERHLLDQQLEAGLRGDFERGWDIAEILKKKTPHCNRARFNRAWYEMMRGNLLAGLECLDAGRWERVFGDKPLPTSKPIWRDEPLQGKHLLLCSEGGFGDEIINVRFAKDFADRGAKVTVTTDVRLASVFSRVEGVSAVVEHRGAPAVYHDYWVPSMSAARVLNYQYSMLKGEPYVSVDSHYRNKWSQYFKKLDPMPRIGLRFYGNPQFEHEQHRRFPKEELVGCLEGSPFANLQIEETNWPIESWEDTIAIIDQLDLVITSCTSVAHASAALGKETWVIVPILPYYLWALPGDRSPWYKSVKLFRQKKYGEWNNVFIEINEELKARGFI